MNKCEQRANEIIKSYEFGRFPKFLNEIYLLEPFFRYNGMYSEEDSMRSAKSDVEQLILLENERFREALQWMIKVEGNFPDLLMRRAHINLVPELNGGLLAKILFYDNAPIELKEKAGELYNSNFKFWRLDAAHGGTKYCYRGQNLEGDVEKIVLVTRDFLNLSHEYLSTLVKK